MPDKQDCSIGDLFPELANETSLLSRQELALAKVELTEKATGVGLDVGFLALGGAIAYAALSALLASAILALANVMPAWAAALIVAAVIGMAGAALISKAIATLSKTELTPRQTVETLKEDAQ